MTKALLTTQNMPRALVGASIVDDGSTNLQTATARIETSARVGGITTAGLSSSLAANGAAHIGIAGADTDNTSLANLYIGRYDTAQGYTALTYQGGGATAVGRFSIVANLRNSANTGTFNAGGIAIQKSSGSDTSTFTIQGDGGTTLLTINSSGQALLAATPLASSTNSSEVTTCGWVRTHLTNYNNGFFGSGNLRIGTSSINAQISTAALTSTKIYNLPDTAGTFVVADASGIVKVSRAVFGTNADDPAFDLQFTSGKGSTLTLGSATLNANASPAPTPQVGALVQLVGADGVRVATDAYAFGAATTRFAGWRANGTNAVKTALAAGDSIANFGGGGYGTTAYSSGVRANMSIRASENWTDTSQGAEIQFYTTRSGSTTGGNTLTLTGTGAAITVSTDITAATGTALRVTQTSATGYGAVFVPGADTGFAALTVNNAANTVNAIQMYGNGSITASGNLLVGTTTSFTTPNVPGALVVSGTAVYPTETPSGNVPGFVTNTVAAAATLNPTFVGNNGLTNQTSSGLISTPFVSNDGTGGTLSSGAVGVIAAPQILSSSAAASVNMTGVAAHALRTRAADTSASATNNLIGLHGIASHTGSLPSTAVSNSVLGVTAGANNQSGTITTLAGVRTTSSIGSASTAQATTTTTASAFHSASFLIGALTGNPATVTNAYGLNLAGPTVAATGTVTTYYGVYLGPATVTGILTNRWGVYQDDAAAKNYLAGDVGIGLTPSGSAKLGVAGVIESTTGGFKFPDGSTQTTAATGGGGGGSLNYTVINTTVALTAGTRYLYNTSGGAFAATLPASPTAGVAIEFADANPIGAMNTLTIARNGSTIEGLSEDMLVTTGGATFTLIYTGTTWRVR
jgi:hypothetical protein